LIYKYFGGKKELLLATILRIQDAFRDQLSPVMEAAGGDPSSSWWPGSDPISRSSTKTSTRWC